VEITESNKSSEKDHVLPGKYCLAKQGNLRALKNKKDTCES